MRIIKKKTNIDFIGKRRPALFISSVLNLAILVGITIFGFNFGVDFAGGTVVELKFDHRVNAEDVRRRAQAAGLHDVSVQGIGSASENSFLLRLGGVTQLTKENSALAETAVQALGPIKFFHADLDNGLINFRAEQKLDPEQIKKAVETTGTGIKEVRSLGEAQGGGNDYQVVVSGMADRVFSAMRHGMEKPDFIVQRVDYVGPQVGKQLRNKGIMSLLYAMVMILIGYSINDTIVVYDRIREEMVRYKGKPLPEIINIAVNDTLSRTILTSGVTALSLVGLLIFGVGEIWDFAMAMLVGIIVGTYSSVYIASPLTIWLDERAAAKERQAKTGMKAKIA